MLDGVFRILSVSFAMMLSKLLCLKPTYIPSYQIYMFESENNENYEWPHSYYISMYHTRYMIPKQGTAPGWSYLCNYLHHAFKKYAIHQLLYVVYIHNLSIFVPYLSHISSFHLIMRRLSFKTGKLLLWIAEKYKYLLLKSWSNHNIMGYSIKVTQEKKQCGIYNGLYKFMEYVMRKLAVRHSPPHPYGHSDVPYRQCTG